MNLPSLNIRSTSFSYLLLLAVGLFAAGCGGGGAAAGPTDGTPDPGDPTEPSALALEILEECGPAALATINAYHQIVSDVAAGNFVSGGFILLGDESVEDPTRIAWGIDLADDPEPDAFGSFTFEDTLAEAVNPFTAQQWQDLLANGISELPSLLATLDNVFLRMELPLLEPPSVLGHVLILYTAGAADTASGDLAVSDGACNTTVTYDDLPVADLAGPVPSATFNVTIFRDASELMGTVSMNGTPNATAALALDGGIVRNFTINLTTGVVAEVP